MIAIPLATYRADPKVAMDLAERDPDGRVVVTNGDGSTYLTIAIPKDDRPSEADLTEQLAEARREIDRLKRMPGAKVMSAARHVIQAALAREREAVDGLIAILEDDDRDCDAWKLVLAAIEAVRKSRERVGVSPPDERLGWSTEIRVRATPSLEFRGLELPDSGEQPVVPRVVAVPDCEGWWARKETRRVEWLYVEPIAETGDEGAPTVLSTWVSAFRRHFPIAEMSGPGIEWSGPFTLPEGWA